MWAPAVEGLRIGRLEAGADGQVSFDRLRLPRAEVLPCLVELHTHLARRLGHEELDPRVVSAGIENLLADPRHGRCVLAWAEGRVLGQVEIKPRFEPWYDAVYWILDNFVVREGFTRRGIGTALLAFVRDWARKQGVPRCRLYVGHENDEARRFYAHRDFVSRGDLMELRV